VSEEYQSGDSGRIVKCPKCKSGNFDLIGYRDKEKIMDMRCKDCGLKWEEKF